MSILRFENDVPQILSLASIEGKNADSQYGPQIMYRTTDGDLFYTPIDFAETLRNHRIAARQQIEICKRKVGRVTEWQIRTAGNQAAGTVSAAPAVQQQQLTNGTTETPGYPSQYRNGNGNGNAHRDQALNAALDATCTALAQAPPVPAQATTTSKELMGCLHAAIDALVEAQTYAGHRGMQRVEFTGEDIRTMANAIYIDRSKRRAA